MTMQSAQQCNPHHDAIPQWNSHNRLGWNAYNKTRIRQCATHDSMRTMEFGRWSPHTGQHDAILQNLQCNPQRHRPKAPARGTGQRHRPKAPAKGTCQRHRPKAPSRPAQFSMRMAKNDAMSTTMLTAQRNPHSAIPIVQFAQ